MEIYTNPLQNQTNERVATNQAAFKPNQTAFKPNEKPLTDNIQLLISLIQQLIVQLSNNSGKVDPPSDTAKSAPTEPVEIAPDSIIGQSFDGEVLDNSTIVDIGGKSYSIGALKLQADAYNQSDFIPETVDLVPSDKPWGSGSIAGTNFFESYILANFPNGLIL